VAATSSSKDGKLAAAEFPLVFKAIISEADSDDDENTKARDGITSKHEQLPVHADQDGKLSAGEFPVARNESMKAKQKNKDGFLSHVELHSAGADEEKYKKVAAAEFPVDNGGKRLTAEFPRAFSESAPEVSNLRSRSRAAGTWARGQPCRIPGGYEQATAGICSRTGQAGRQPGSVREGQPVKR